MNLDRQAKNRIVGVMVLTALGAMFLPELLNGEKVKVEEQFATISLRPEVKPSAPPDGAFDFGPTADVEPATTPPPSSFESGSVADLIPPPKPKPQPPAVTTPTPVEKPSSSLASNLYGWTLRVGTFGNASNVAGLIEKLRKDGYTSYSIPATPVDGKLTRVFVGPELSEQKMQQIQARLKQEYDLNSQLLNYDPQQF